MRHLVAAGIASLAAAVLPSQAAAEPIAGYDGSNPFDCELQDVGGGTDFPHPGADPFCVKYDKTHQNVNRLGLVAFLSKEPARVAAATDKCFYYQTDSWRGSVVQGVDRTETYRFDGSYFFDKARGVGGAYVEDFHIARRTGDPTTLPGFPPQYREFFGPGRGGVQSVRGVPIDPACVAKARSEDPYRSERSCRVPGGEVRRGIGGARLGMTRRQVERALGPATEVTARFLRYCLEGRGDLHAGFPRREAAGAGFVMTRNRAFDVDGVRRGSSTRRARHTLDGEEVKGRPGGLRLLVVREDRRALVVGVRRGEVRFLAVAKPRLSLERIRRYLELSR